MDTNREDFLRGICSSDSHFGDRWTIRRQCSGNFKVKVKMISLKMFLKFCFKSIMKMFWKFIIQISNFGWRFRKYYYSFNKQLSKIFALNWKFNFTWIIYITTFSRKLAPAQMQSISSTFETSRFNFSLIRSAYLYAPPPVTLMVLLTESSLFSPLIKVFRT